MLGVRTSSAVGGGSIRWNNYAYAGSNPVNYLDPSGMAFLSNIGTSLRQGFSAAGIPLPGGGGNPLDCLGGILGGLDPQTVRDLTRFGMSMFLGPVAGLVFNLFVDIAIEGKSLEEAIKNGVIDFVVDFTVGMVFRGLGLVDDVVQSPHYRGTLNGDVDAALGVNEAF